MSEICPKCGLPKELCVCGTISKETASIKIKVEKKKFGKKVTIITGITKDIDVKQLTKFLKGKLACGGTFKDNIIELQGDHKHNIKKFLVDYGFNPDTIEVI